MAKDKTVETVDVDVDVVTTDVDNGDDSTQLVLPKRIKLTGICNACIAKTIYLDGDITNQDVDNIKVVHTVSITTASGDDKRCEMFRSDIPALTVGTAYELVCESKIANKTGYPDKNGEMIAHKTTGYAVQEVLPVNTTRIQNAIDTIDARTELNAKQARALEIIASASPENQALFINMYAPLLNR